MGDQLLYIEIITMKVHVKILIEVSDVLGGFCLFIGYWFCLLEGGAIKRAICDEITNHQNTGLISVDRKTSLLSHVQYPVPYQSRLQRI